MGKEICSVSGMLCSVLWSTVVVGACVVRGQFDTFNAEYGKYEGILLQSICFTTRKIRRQQTSKRINSAIVQQESW